MVSQCYEKWLLSLLVISKWRPSAKKYGLLSVFVDSKWCPSAKKYDFLPVYAVPKR